MFMIKSALDFGKFRNS